MNLVDEKFERWFNEAFPPASDSDNGDNRNAFKISMKIAFIEGLKVGFSASFDSHLNKNITKVL